MRSPHRRPASAAADGRNSSESSAHKERKGYKVIQESILQERQKLVTHEVYTKESPHGYTFVPVGRPDLTDECRELARKSGLPVFIVSDGKAPKEKGKEKISEHIHRIGYHFPNKVVEDSLVKIGIRNLKPNGAPRLLPDHIRGAAEFTQDFVAQNLRLGDDASQPVSDHMHRKNVSAAIKELFPLIPEDDQRAIVQRAFAKRANTVGNSNLPMARKIQLATLAHIRHTHTDYDGLLRPFGWSNARALIEEKCLEKIKQWRGEKKDDGKGDLVELEQILRETIVLDDDSDSDLDQMAAANPPRVPTQRSLAKPPRVNSQPKRGRRSNSSSSSIEVWDSLPRPESGPNPRETRRIDSRPDKRRRLAHAAHSPRTAHAEWTQEPQIIRPSTAQIVQPRPVRGPQPAQINHLDEVSRNYAPPTPYHPETYENSPREYRDDLFRTVPLSGEYFDLPHRQQHLQDPIDNNTARNRHHARNIDIRHIAIAEDSSPRPILRSALPTARTHQPRPIRRANYEVWTIPD